MHAPDTKPTGSRGSAAENDRETLRANLEAWHDVMSGTVSLPSDAHVFHQGDVQRNVYMLERGVVKLVVLDESGRQSILALAHAPAFLGSASIIADRPSPVAAVTASPSDLRWCSAFAFQTALERAPARLLHVYRLQCVEAIEVFEALTMLKQRSSKKRLAMFLQRLESDRTKSNGEPAHASVPLRQFEVASLLGISPEHLSRISRTAYDRRTRQVVDGGVAVRATAADRRRRC